MNRRDTSGGGAVGRGPESWAFPLFLAFGAAQLIAGVIMFFAYNWRALPDVAKIGLPQAAMAAFFLLFVALKPGSPFRTAAGIGATMMIGVSMGVVGQVYQQGADPWTLFAIWAAFALPLALIAQSDAHFTVAFAIASTAYTLWAGDHIAGRFSSSSAVIGAIYAVLATATLMIRDYAAAPIAGPAPRWQRWVFAAAALGPAASGAIGELTADEFLSAGGFATLAFAAIAALILIVYGSIRPDRPTRAMALFAIAVVVAFALVQAIWRFDINGTGAVALALAASACVVVGVTAALAVALRRNLTAVKS